MKIKQFGSMDPPMRSELLVYLANFCVDLFGVKADEVSGQGKFCLPGYTGADPERLLRGGANP